MAAASFAGQGMGRGCGWKTIENIAQDLNRPLDKLFQALEDMGIEAGKDEVVRTVSERSGLSAYELVERLQKIR